MHSRIVLERNALFTEKFVEQREGQVSIMHPSKHFYFSKAFTLCSQRASLFFLSRLPFLPDPSSKLQTSLSSTTLKILLSPCYSRFELPSPSMYLDKNKRTSSHYDASWCRQPCSGFCLLGQALYDLSHNQFISFSFFLQIHTVVSSFIILVNEIFSIDFILKIRS